MLRTCLTGKNVVCFYWLVSALLNILWYMEYSTPILPDWPESVLSVNPPPLPSYFCVRLSSISSIIQWCAKNGRLKKQILSCKHAPYMFCGAAHASTAVATGCYLVIINNLKTWFTMVISSLFPRPKHENKKGSGFSCSRMQLIAVEFNCPRRPITRVYMDV